MFAIRGRGLAALSTLALATVLLPSGVALGQASPPDHVQTFGSATHHGSLDTLAAAGTAVPDVSVTALVPTPSGAGYWVVLADGSVYSFGDARFAGSVSALREAGTPLDPSLVVVAAARTPSGAGYWLTDDQGGVYSFGDAPFLGSLPTLRAQGLVTGAVRIVAMAATSSGAGYWLTDDQGGVYSFGNAPFHGSARGSLTEPVTGFAATPSNGGYRILTADGRVRGYGAAGDLGAATVTSAVGALALASSPIGDGYWVVTPQIRPASGAPGLPPGSGSGRRIVYSNSRQRVWLVEATGVVSHSWAVSGRRGVPAPGNYRVFSKSPASTAHGGSLVLRHMVRFAHGQSLAIGFHAIPTAGGRPIQGEDELGQYRSAGCVRQRATDAATLYAWAPLGTAVVVTA